MSYYIYYKNMEKKVVKCHNKKADKKQETAYINVFGDKSKPDYFYVQHATDLPEDKFFQKSLSNLVDLNQLTEISSNCSIPINSGVNP